MRYEKWDGSPLGGLKSEEEVRRHFGMGPDDVAYVIRNDAGEIVYFQPHVPFVQGIVRMKQEDWEERARKHFTRIMERLERIEKAKVDGGYDTAPF